MLLRIAGWLGLVPAIDWLFLGLFLSAYGYHEYALHEKGVEVRNEDRAQLVAANAKAKADHDALQAKIDAQASVSNAALHDQFDKIQADLRTLGTYKPKKPLPADCKLDAERVTLANKEREQ